MRSNQQLIVHAHMFKNAGTTVDWSLRRNFGTSFLDHRDDYKMRNEQGYFQRLVQDRTDLKAISSHSVPLPLTDVAGVTLNCIIMLRHPISRVRSVYDFEKSQTENTAGAKNAKKMSFKQYVEWRMRPEVGATIRDFQVRFLTSALPYNRYGLSEKFDVATQFVEDNPLTGIVEQYDQSMLVFEQYLAKVDQDIDLAYKVQNVSDTKSQTLQQRLDGIKDELGNYLWELLIENNTHDTKLYELAHNALRKRFDSIENQAEKLQQLSQRCKSLHSLGSVNNPKSNLG